MAAMAVLFKALKRKQLQNLEIFMIILPSQ
jgi:hypothetical protein